MTPRGFLCLHQIAICAVFPISLRSSSTRGARRRRHTGAPRREVSAPVCSRFRPLYGPRGPLPEPDNRRGCGLLVLVLGLTLAATATLARDCTVVEPDSLQINWTAPCEDGSWLLDPQTGCRLWDWNPAPEDTATWSGSCPRGLKEGAGAVQWFEHGRPIDRFEGVFERGRRKGFGRYYWPTDQRFEGYYDADLPNGQGTVIIDGVSYAGIWRRGCLEHKDKLIAIGVPLGTCISDHSGKR